MILRGISGVFLACLMACASPDGAATGTDYRDQGELVKTISYSGTDEWGARPGLSILKPVPPKQRHFQKCLDWRQKSVTAKVHLSFDVSEQGKTENIRVLETTDRCFNWAFAVALENWEYNVSPAATADARTGLVTTIVLNWGE